LRGDCTLVLAGKPSANGWMRFDPEIMSAHPRFPDVPSREWDAYPCRRFSDKEEMAQLLRRVRKVIPGERLRVNPDCGLKTRRWEDVAPAMRAMAVAAEALRREL
jgi:hypothetical protein